MKNSIYQQVRRLTSQQKLILNSNNSLMSKRCASGHQHCFLPSSSYQIETQRFKTTSKGISPVVFPDNTFRSHLPDVDIPNNVSFHEYIFGKCDEFKDQLAVEEFLTGKKYTYSQLKEKSVKVASGLHKMGYRKGDVLLAMSPNNVNYTVLMLACAATGIWFCAANPAFTADELARQLNLSGSVVVVSTQELTGVVKEALAHKEISNKVKDLLVFGECRGFQPFQNLLDDDGKSFPDVDINPVEDVMTLPYSSGTTGLPKGVMLTHYNCFANCLQTQESFPATQEDRCLGILPLYHIYGMIVVQFSVLQDGASIFYLPKFEPETFLRCIQEKKISIAHLVPPLIVFLTKHPMVSNYDVTSLKKIVCGAAPLGTGITKEFLERHRHGLVLNQGYGMTELSPVTNLDTTRTAGSVGNLVVNTLGKIVDIETGKALGPGQEGEFCVKGPQVMKGYFNNKKATDETIKSDGWLHTGDIGYFDKDGLVYIHDRLKELIKYKGSQVPPAELEALLLSNPEIHDVAVVGIPDEVAGELPKAFVVKKPDSHITEKEIIKFVEAKVAHTKRLRGGVQFVDEIPKNASGKILRRVLKSKYV